MFSLLILFHLIICAIRDDNAERARLKRALRAVADARESGDVPVVSFTTPNYIGVAEHWINSTAAAGIGRGAVLVVALLTHQSIAEFGCAKLVDDDVNCAEVYVGEAITNLNAFWELRMLIMRGLLEYSDGPIIFGDVDAIWRLDVRQLLLRYASYFGADMLFSRGVGLPRSHLVMHGFVHCMGLWLAFPTPAVLRFLRSEEANARNDGGPFDDQIQLNEAMIKFGVMYVRLQQDVRVGSMALNNATERLNVANVPYTLVARKCPNVSPIAHCRGKKGIEFKLARLADIAAVPELPPPLGAPRVHMIDRGSALSTYLRDALGCTPPGPCCKPAREPNGTCDKAHGGTPCNLFGCELAQGFTRDHYNFVVLSLRSPLARACATYRRPGHHYDPSDTFARHIKRPRYRNVLAQMLSGQRAYLGAGEQRLKSSETLRKIIRMNIDAVVTYENFASDLDALHEMMSHRYALHEAASRRKTRLLRDADERDCTADISDDDRALFAHVNKLDIELHEFIMANLAFSR